MTNEPEYRRYCTAGGAKRAATKAGGVRVVLHLPDGSYTQLPHDEGEWPDGLIVAIRSDGEWRAWA